MTFKKAPLIIIAITLFASILAYVLLANYPYSTANIDNGKTQYLANCVFCHGDNGHGDGTAAVGFEVKPDNIFDELQNPFGLKAELIHSVLDGENGQNGQMPAFGHTLSKEDVNDIFAYIESVNE
ncbi:c-type cytochrome [Photobacterium satsumensis]|uniref:c-type cytochrome n=1 Tax=Photobacterium satsumensis TaxID=2910239 RepID=UPI003D0E493B